jgi:N-acetylglucosamine-6-phosphate deacetylase
MVTLAPESATPEQIAPGAGRGVVSLGHADCTHAERGGSHGGGCRPA